GREHSLSLWVGSMLRFSAFDCSGLNAKTNQQQLLRLAALFAVEPSFPRRTGAPYTVRDSPEVRTCRFTGFWSRSPLKWYLWRNVVSGLLGPTALWAWFSGIRRRPLWLSPST